MLTEGQTKYLDTLSDDQKMVVKPFNPKGLDIAEEIIARVKSAIPELEVTLLGSLPLRISGQEDIDISVWCIKSEQSKYLESLVKLFGEPTKQTENTVRWDFNKDGFSVGLWLTDPTTQTSKGQIAVFNLLKNNPDLCREYETIKVNAKDLNYKEYQRAKYEFYNRILGIGN